MKCIDALEGAVKSILQQIHLVSLEQNLDDSEYIRNIKAIIDGTDRFIQNNPEVVDEPELIKQVLYLYSRNLWLMHPQSAEQIDAEKIDGSISDNEEYQTYYFDFLYNRGFYPR